VEMVAEDFESFKGWMLGCVCGGQK